MLHERFGEVVAKIEEILNSPRLMVFGRVDAWLKSGADPELDIFPTLRRIAAQGRWNGSTLSYFDNAIAQSLADRTKPLPVLEPRARKSPTYAPPPSSPETEDYQDRSRAELLAKGIRVMSATDTDVRRIVRKGYLRAEMARNLGYDVPEQMKAG